MSALLSPTERPPTAYPSNPKPTRSLADLTRNLFGQLPGLNMVIYGSVLFLSTWLSDIAGSGGLYAVALVSGLTDVDAITLSSLRLFNLKQLTEQQTIIAITLAYLSNLSFKFGMVIFLGGGVLAKRVAPGFITIATAMIIALFAL